MIVKKPATVLCAGTWNGLLFSYWSSPPWTITSSYQPRVHSPQPSLLAESKSTSAIRRFATIQPDKQSKPDDNEKPADELPWPASPCPTPYEIFNLSKDAPYSKRRYYELVMRYHPDRRHHTTHDGIPHLTKLDRYRLVVSANDILSDPERRRLYDLNGAGWGSQPNVRSRYRAADTAWHQEPGNASMNATWEDWERWHQERDGVKQTPVFMSNAMFASFIVVFVMLAGWGEMTRAGRRSADLLEIQNQRHTTISRQIHKRENQLMGLSREDRVRRFIRERESWEYDRPSRRPISDQAETASKEA